ncbi:hypothetical protein CkaCkLH20_12528 [Colletotrichum karsti]|uniref:Transcription factor domain-containing protein n=1 Tax=Colletotrichum karsti TaxID=1095194 RepID=A0A9P6HT37_9PEZI|nr:uncharacterized protein CkaCkLH20_12528 [Colletotrichum karsti]KAF9870048.1 hypothetical protein CkaCkLH20_12528 [Colletotrichum karsti]
MANLQPSSSWTPRDDQQQYVSAVHKMMRWDAVRKMLVEAGISAQEADFLKPNFPSLILEQQGRTEPLPISSTIKLGQLKPVFVNNRSTTYFSTFHLLHPILDEQNFRNTTVSKAFNRGRLTDNVDATLVLLVLALADMGEATCTDPGLVQQHIQQHGGPPGLSYFNEARRRMGFFVADCTLETVQLLILAGGLNLELEQPLTGLTSLRENEWGLNESMFSDNLNEDGSELYEQHFYSHINLRYHAREIHRSLTAMNNIGVVSAQGYFTQKERDLLSSNLSKEVEARARHLNDWRDRLNDEMQWVEMRWNESNKKTEAPVSLFPNTSEALYETQYPIHDDQIRQVYFPDVAQPMEPQLEQLQQLQQLQQMPLEAFGPAGVDVILNALLKSRYYYLRCLLYRPYIYRILHSDRMYQSDMAGAKEYLRACVLWPIIMPPVCNSKAMIPSLYLWTHNILGVLVILYLSETNPRLMRVRDEMTPSNKPNVFAPRAQETVRLCIEWIRSLQTTDKSAEWCWLVVKRLYRIPDETSDGQYLV